MSAKKNGQIARSCNGEESPKSKPRLAEPKLKNAVSTPIKCNTKFVLDPDPSQHVSNDVRSFGSLEDIKTGVSSSHRG